MRPLARHATPLALVLGCAVGPAAQGPVLRPSISVVSARCPGASSCVLGHVSASLDAGPIAKAAVFLQREGEALAGIQTLTDEQGVFTLIDPPPGRYRVVVIKDGAKVEASGLELGRPGTTLIPIRLMLE